MEIGVKGFFGIIIHTLIVAGGVFLSSRFGLNRKTGEMIATAGLGAVAGASLIGGTIYNNNKEKKKRRGRTIFR